MIDGEAVPMDPSSFGWSSDFDNDVAALQTWRRMPIAKHFDKRQLAHFFRLRMSIVQFDSFLHRKYFRLQLRWKKIRHDSHVIPERACPIQNKLEFTDQRSPIFNEPSTVLSPHMRQFLLKERMCRFPEYDSLFIINLRECTIEKSEKNSKSKMNESTNTYISNKKVYISTI